MSVLLDREFIVQAVVILAVCLGAWMMAVQPKVRELARLEQTIAENSPAAGAINQQTVQDAAARMNTVRQRLTQIDAANRLASDSSKLYGLVMDLADTHGVQVQSLQPGAMQKKSPTETQVSVMRLDLTVEGSYENIAGFLEAVNDLDVFIRPNSLQVAPTRVNGKALVSATFGCDVLSFAMGDTLSGLMHPGATPPDTQPAPAPEG